MASVLEERVSGDAGQEAAGTVYAYTRTTGQEGAADVLGSQQAKATAIFWKLKEASEGLAWGGFHIDLDPAARTRPLVQRPEGWKVFRQLRNGDYLLLGSIELVGKSVGDFVETVRKARERGVNVQLLEPAVDFETPEGQQFLTALEATGKAEHKRRCEERRNQVRKCRQSGRMMNKKLKPGNEILSGKCRGRQIHYQFPDVAKTAICRLISMLAHRGLKGTAISHRLEELLCAKVSDKPHSPRFVELDNPTKPRPMSRRHWNRQNCDNALKWWRTEGQAAWIQELTQLHKQDIETGLRCPLTRILYEPRKPR